MRFEEIEREEERPVSKWIDDLSEKDQIRATVFMTRVREVGKVCYPPHFKPFRDLCEARWFGVNKVPHRIFCYGEEPTILLCGFIHKDKQYKPRDAYGIASRRKREIEDGEATTHEFNLGQAEQEDL